MSKIYVAQRERVNNPTMDSKNKTIRVEINTDGNKLVETVLPANMKPDHIQVSTDIKLKERISQPTPISPYVDTIKVSDVDGNRVYPTSEIAKGLGIADSTNVNRLEQRLKEMTYKDSDINVYVKDVDYTELSSELSQKIRKADKMVSVVNSDKSHSPQVTNDLLGTSSDTPLPVNSDKSRSSHMTNDLLGTSSDTPLPVNSDKSRSPQVVNDLLGTSSDTPLPVNSDKSHSSHVTNDLLGTSQNIIKPLEGNAGNVYTQPITVWSTQATLKIATSANTLQGESLANKVQTEYLTNGSGNVDIIEDIIESNNKPTAIEHQVDVAEGHSRVSDVVSKCSIPVKHADCIKIGNFSAKMAHREGTTINKATAASYSNTLVNTYPTDIVVDALKVVLDDDDPFYDN